MFSINIARTRRSALGLIGGSAAFATLVPTRTPPGAAHALGVGSYGPTSYLYLSGKDRLYAALACLHAGVEFYEAMATKVAGSYTIGYSWISEVLEDKHRHLRELESSRHANGESSGSPLENCPEQTVKSTSRPYVARAASSMLRNALSVEGALIERLIVLLDGVPPATGVLLENMLLDTRYHQAVIRTLIDIQRTGRLADL